MRHKKNIFYIDLKNREFEIKKHEDLNHLVGGVGLGLKLISENIERNPLVLACGPLSGIFPYASKTCLLAHDKNGIIELYGGGDFAFKMRMANIDAIVIYGKAENATILSVASNSVEFIDFVKREDISKVGISGRKSIIYFGKYPKVNTYFSFGTKKIGGFNLKALAVTGDGEISLNNKREYWNLYKRILSKKNQLSIKYSNNPSCGGCPAGCVFSHQGEDRKIGVLPRSLISCQFAEEIYKNVPLVFSCLALLGYKYNHEDLENLPRIVGEVKKNLEHKISNNTVK